MVESSVMLAGQRCKVCDRRDKFDFHVSDGTWAAVVPPTFRNRVVCLACFDDLACQKGVDYSTEITTIYFAGDAASFIFRPVSATSSDSYPRAASPSTRYTARR